MRNPTSLTVFTCKTLSDEVGGVQLVKRYSGVNGSGDSDTSPLLPPDMPTRNRTSPKFTYIHLEAEFLLLTQS